MLFYPCPSGGPNWRPKVPIFLLPNFHLIYMLRGACMIALPCSGTLSGGEQSPSQLNVAVQSHVLSASLEERRYGDTLNHVWSSAGQGRGGWRRLPIHGRQQHRQVYNFLAACHITEHSGRHLVPPFLVFFLHLEKRETDFLFPRISSVLALFCNADIAVLNGAQNV